MKLRELLADPEFKGPLPGQCWDIGSHWAISPSGLIEHKGPFNLVGTGVLGAARVLIWQSPVDGKYVVMFEDEFFSAHAMSSFSLWRPGS